MMRLSNNQHSPTLKELKKWELKKIILLCQSELNKRAKKEFY